MSHLNRRDWLKVAAVAPAALVAFPRTVFAAPSADDVKAVVDKALTFFKTAQKENGSFGTPRSGEPGLTALIVSALIKNGVSAEDPTIAKGLKYLESKVQKDGGVYDQGLSNYMTSLAIMTFKEANAGGKYDKVIESAGKYVKSLQFAEGLTEKDANFGGAGYDKPGGRARPDMSNTHFMVEALLASGVSKDDPSIKRALVYISRSQNLASDEFNNLPFAKKAGEADKGGFVYNLSDADNPKSPKLTAEGGLRSEGGMTYAGLKSFLYAGVGKDDKRVQAAVNWVRQHYTVTENPGQKDSGLYYYYHTFAKAMDALGEDEFADAKGTKHDWRQELFDELKKRQKENGSWVNSNGAFLENLPELATAFAVLSISYCKKK